MNMVYLPILKLLFLIAPSCESRSFIFDVAVSVAASVATFSDVVVDVVVVDIIVGTVTAIDGVVVVVVPLLSGATSLS